MSRSLSLAGTYRARCTGSVRVARFGSTLRGGRGDLVISSRVDTIVVITGPDGVPGAAVPAETALSAMMRDPVKLRLLTRLESGAKDEVIARALGVSLRTCRRRIAGLLSAADAVSRFQAASALGRAGALGAARRAG